MAVTRDGVPVRCWTFPGDAADTAIIRTVKDDLDGWGLRRLVWVADRRFASATAAPPAADEAIRVAEASGSPIAIAWSCYAAGEIRLGTEPDEALKFLERALDAAASVGERTAFGAAQLSALSLRCREHVDNRDTAACLAAYHELIQHWLRLGAWVPLWTTVRNLAELLVARRRHDRAAARLLGAADTSLTSAPAYGAQARRLDTAAAEARSRLGPEFDAELAAGRRLGDHAAVALALKATDPGGASTAAPVVTCARLGTAGCAISRRMP